MAETAKTPTEKKPVILITGAAGNIGVCLTQALKGAYTVIGIDLKPCPYAQDNITCDLTSPPSVESMCRDVREKYGPDIAAVIHLAAYFDFTGEPSPLYETVNIEGTRVLVKALQSLHVERFIYASTMLVHKPGVPGKKIDETQPVSPKWAYPKSKAAAERIILDERGDMPCTILRLAGLYDDETAVPTLSNQIARIYERDIKSHLYAGDMMAGQAFIHQEDMTDLFTRVIEKRNTLPAIHALLAGEDDVMNYRELQNRLGFLIFGTEEWHTINIPEIAAKSAAWLEEKAEPLIPDAIDNGEKPFVRPFMIDLASDHYDIDISPARAMLNWQPKRRIYDGLTKLVDSLKKNPQAWYENNNLTPPDWLQGAAEKHRQPDQLRQKHKAEYRRIHGMNIWAHFLNLGMAAWLVTAPFVLGYESTALTWSDVMTGAALAVFGLMSLSWRMGWARWVCGMLGLWLLAAPLVFWAPTSASYMNDTICGMLVIGFAVLSRPAPGISAVADCTGPTIPPGWDYSPSGWFQRVPIILLAFIGFFVSRYLAAYQLGHIETVWEPFFPGGPDPKNGTEEIITSSVSQAWPVPDAGLGAVTYALEILTGMIGSARRWRTMPWLVVLFGIMIVPLGIVSITFIIIQPIIIGTWCTLCLIAAAAMLVQIPYSVDEVIATGQFLYRRKKKGRSMLRVFFTGDTDEGDSDKGTDNFAQSPALIIREMLGGGVNMPWNLVICTLIGAWLMFTRITLGATGGMADADHLIGALVITIAITAMAEAARAVRFLILPLGFALLVVPFIYETSMFSLMNSVICGLALIVLSWRRGPVNNRYGTCDKYII